MPGDTFTCANPRCRRKYIKTRPDEVALEEMDATWKRYTRDLAAFCEDCHADMLAWAKEHHPEWLK